MDIILVYETRDPGSIPGQAFIKKIDKINIIIILLFII